MPGNAEPLRLFVVHWNQPDECAATVRAFLGQGVPIKITVVDNHSARAGYEKLRAVLDSDVEMIRLSENKGWGPALNVVLRNWLDMETGRFCLIAAHDAAPSPDCLRLLAGAVLSDEKIGIAAPQYPDATIPRLSGRRGIYYEAGTPSAPGSVQYVEAPHGTLMLARRECLQQIGLFDERYFAYGDEHELGVRARRYGWKVVIVWGAIVTNPGTWTESPLRSYFFARNSLLLVRDYCGAGSAFLRALMILLNTLRLTIKPPNKAFAFSWRARLRAVRDYFLGRWGKPDFAG